MKGDVLAGLTTAVLLVPQSMAYALLAGLPPIAGLYASTVPLLAYALVGRVPQLAVGPVAMDSLLTAATVGALAQVGEETYAQLAALLALLVGALQLALGALRGGFLVNFLSKPVINGFTSAAAVLIGVSQLPTLLGLDLPRASTVSASFAQIFAALGLVRLPTFALGAACVVALLFLKARFPKLPRHLMVLIAAVGVALVAADGTFDMVGSVPPGLPAFRAPNANLLAQAPALLSGALTIALVSFMEAISVSSKLAERAPNADREFAALGAANVAAGFFGGFPVAGGLSRSAVLASAGAKTRLAGVVTAVFVALTLVAFSDLLRFVPKAALAAIVMVAVAGLFDAREPRRLWRVKRSDLLLLCCTFLATLILGIQQGIAVGVGLSLLALVLRSTRPHTAVLGRLPGTDVFRNVLRFPDAITIPGVVILRMDAPVFFGNVNFLKSTLAELEAAETTPLRAVVLDASGINQLDASGESALREILDDYRARDIELCLASVKGPVRDVLARSGFSDAPGQRAFFRVCDAVDALSANPNEDRSHEKS